MVGDRDLQEVAGDSFVPEDGARVFDRRTDVEVARLAGLYVGIQSETRRWVLVVLARRIHEAAGTRVGLNASGS